MDEHPTLVTCLSCGGHYRTLVARVENVADAHRPGDPAPKGLSKTWTTVLCAFCTMGAMTPKQVAVWSASRSSRPSIPREE